MARYLNNRKHKVLEVFTMESNNDLQWVIYLAIRSIWPFYWIKKDKAYSNVKKFVGCGGGWVEKSDDQYLGVGRLASTLNAIASEEALSLIKTHMDAHHNRRYEEAINLKSASVKTKISGSEIGSRHWFITLLSEQKRIGEYLTTDTPSEEILKIWGGRVYESGIELIAAIDTLLSLVRLNNSGFKTKHSSIESKVSGCAPGSHHWFVTLLSEQKRIGDYLSRKDVNEDTLKSWGKTLYENSGELIGAIESWSDATYTFSDVALSLNPVEQFADWPDECMRMLILGSGLDSLSAHDYDLAREIALRAAANNPSVIDLLDAWRKEPSLAEFSGAVAASWLSN